MLANIVFTVASLLAPAFVAWITDAPERIQWGLGGLAIGLIVGWWGLYLWLIFGQRVELLRGGSKGYLQSLASKKREREKKKAKKNLRKVLAEGKTLSADGRFVIAESGDTLCRACVESGRHEVAVTKFPDGRYLCPLCRQGGYVPLSDIVNFQ